MAKQMDDEGLKPRPQCEVCRSTLAAWVVTMSRGVVGLGAARLMMCTGCAKKQNGRPRRALKSSDY